MPAPISRTHTVPMPESAFVTDGAVHPLWLDADFWRARAEEIRADEPARLERIEANRLRRKRLREDARETAAARTINEHAS